MTKWSIITFRVSGDLRQKIEGRAAATGLDLSNFCRAVMINTIENEAVIKI